MRKLFLLRVKKISVVFLVFFIFTVTAITKAEEKSVKLNLKFKAGETLKFKFVGSGEGEYSVNNSAAIPFKTKLSMDITGKVQDVSADGITSLELTASNLKVNVQPSSINSLVKIPEDISKVPVIFKIASSGRILEIVGLEYMPTVTDAQIILKLIALSSPYLAQIYPEEKIKAGDKWTVSVGDVKNLADISFLVSEIKDDVATINSSTNFPISTVNQVYGGDYNPARAVVKSQTEAKLNLKTFKMEEMNSKLEVESISIITNKTKDGYNTQTIKVKFKGDLKISLEK